MAGEKEAFLVYLRIDGFVHLVVGIFEVLTSRQSISPSSAIGQPVRSVSQTDNGSANTNRAELLHQGWFCSKTTPAQVKTPNRAIWAVEGLAQNDGWNAGHDNDAAPRQTGGLIDGQASLRGGIS